MLVRKGTRNFGSSLNSASIVAPTLAWPLRPPLLLYANITCSALIEGLTNTSVSTFRLLENWHSCWTKKKALLIDHNNGFIIKMRDFTLAYWWFKASQKLSLNIASYDVSHHSSVSARWINPEVCNRYPCQIVEILAVNQWFDVSHLATCKKRDFKSFQIPIAFLITLFFIFFFIKCICIYL